MSTPLTRLPQVHVPSPDPAFRSRLRGAFVAGALAPARRPAAAWAYAWAAAAVLVAVSALAMLARDGAGWRVDAVAGGGVEVDGRPYPPSDLAAIGRALHPGARVHVPAGGQLDLELPGVAALQAVERTTFTLPRLPRGGAWRAGRGRVETGELRVATMPGFRGRWLDMRMPQAEVAVTGTVFALLVEPGRSCVCVFEGSVRMRDESGTETRVLEGTRRSVGTAGRDPQVIPLPPNEVMKLGMMRDRWRVPR